MEALTVFFSIDVECAATGPQHDARSPVRVALVDAAEKVLYSSFVKPKDKVFNFLTPLTGVQEQDVKEAPILEDVCAEIKKILRSQKRLPVLVGAAIHHDVEWLFLKKGEDYDHIIDLAEMFKAWNPRYGQYNKFSLAHLSQQLLGVAISEQHSPEVDAQLSVRLYNRYKDDEAECKRAASSMIGKRAPENFAKKHNYYYQGVCMAGYYPEKCKCGSPTKK